NVNHLCRLPFLRKISDRKRRIRRLTRRATSDHFFESLARPPIRPADREILASPAGEPQSKPAALKRIDARSEVLNLPFFPRLRRLQNHAMLPPRLGQTRAGNRILNRTTSRNGGRHRQRTRRTQ